MNHERWESGTDVYRSFTKVYVVSRIENKPSNWQLYMQAFSSKYFYKAVNILSGTDL
jgi:hypothetical protein